MAKQSYKQRIGSIIQQARLAKDMTQAELAAEVGTSQSAVNRIEKGGQNLSIELLGRISEVLGYDTVTGTNDETHTCALAYTTATTDARVYCWGSNDDTSTAGYVEYYLGNGSTAGQSNVPVLSGMTASSDLINSMGSTPIITDIAATAAGACVLAYPSATNAASTRPYCWGHRQTRGDDDPGDSSGIVSTPHARRVTDASTTGIVYNNQATGLVGGAYRACTIVNYRIYCWGANNSGQIGFGSTTPTNVYSPREATDLRPSPARTLF